MTDGDHSTARRDAVKAAGFGLGAGLSTGLVGLLLVVSHAEGAPARGNATRSFLTLPGAAES